MKTDFLLMAQYSGQAIIPLETLHHDYFSRLTWRVFLRKLDSGEIPLAVVRLEVSQKGARGVYLTDFARYLDACHEAAIRELQALQS